MLHVMWRVCPVTYLRIVSRTYIYVRVLNFNLISILPILHIYTINVLCTGEDDHTRVELKKEPEVEGSDYINASFIDVSFVF